MKKQIILILFLGLLVFPLISAVQVDMNNNSKQGETLIVKISGNFLEPVLKENIYFYRDYAQVPFEFDLLKIQEDYYFSTSTLGKQAGNYSIVIKDSKYYIACGEISKKDIITNFLIKNESADFSVTLGILIVNKSFSLEIQNLKDEELIIYINKNSSQEKQEEPSGFFSFLFGNKEESHLEGESIILKAGETKQVELEFKDILQPTFKNIELKTENFTQNILVYALATGKEEKLEIKNIKFELNNLNISMSTNSSKTKFLYLNNIGTSNLENVSLIISDSLKDYIKIEPEFLEEFEANKSKRITLNISSKDEEEIINGTIKAISNNTFSYINISLNITKGIILEDNQTENNKPIIAQTCAEKNGTICKESEKCSIETEYAADGNCCLSECIEKKKSSIGKTIAWILIIIFIGIYVWFYFKKYKKTKSKTNLLKIAEGKKEK